MEKKDLKVGMRIWKTVISIFLCYLIDLFRTGGNIFYAMIAAASCMGSNMENSKQTAHNRIIATLIGGFWGCVYITLGIFLNIKEDSIFRGMLISLLIIPTIKTACLLKEAKASYLSCVVLLSIVIIHGFDNNPYLFALNRIIDTLLGIIVSMVVNCLLPNKKEG